MSDPVTREEFEALRERVAELEAAIGEDDRTTEPGDGLDHRDRAVLDHMREHGKASKIHLVKLYIRATDIQDRSKAKRRAQALEQHPAYEEL